MTFPMVNMHFLEDHLRRRNLFGKKKILTDSGHLKPQFDLIKLQINKGRGQGYQRGISGEKKGSISICWGTINIGLWSD